MWWRTEVHRRFSSYRIYYISRLFDNLLTGFQCNLYTFFIHWGYYLSTLTTRWAWEPKVIEDRPNPALQDPIFLFVGECYQFFLYACVIVMKHITTNVVEPNVKVLLHSTRYVVLIHGRSIRLWFDESLSHSQFTLFWYNYLPFDTCQGSNSWWTFGNSSLIIFRTDVARSVVMRSISTPSLKMRWLRPPEALGLHGNWTASFRYLLTKENRNEWMSNSKKTNTIHPLNNALSILCHPEYSFTNRTSSILVLPVVVESEWSHYWIEAETNRWNTCSCSL